MAIRSTDDGYRSHTSLVEEGQPEFDDLASDKARTGDPQQGPMSPRDHSIAANAFDNTAWYWCLEHEDAEPSDSNCAPDRRLGPYPTREAAEHWKTTVEARNEAWERADESWNDSRDRAARQADRR